MFRLEESSVLYALFLLPLFGILYYYARLKLDQRRATFGSATQLNKLIHSDENHLKSLALILTAVFFLVLALANPQWGLKKEKVKVDKSDIFIALDISNSMNATDISPSRLEKAKKFVSQFIQTRKGDQIGLILFAGGAYLQMPLTSDYAGSELFVKSANTDMAGTQGTAIGPAIDLAMRSIKEKNQRALIILSDGEDHDEEALDMAKKAKDQGWHIFTIGVGTETGSFVPVIQDGREEFKVDESGNPVKSMVNTELLKQIAKDGGGNFYTLSDAQTTLVQDINQQIDKLEKRAVEIKSFTEYRSYYQYLLLTGLIFLLIEFFSSFKYKWS